MAKNKTSLENKMKTYIFRVVIEPDEDRWFAYCPILKGCATWGYTREEALKNIQEVVEIWVKDMIEAGENIPVEEIKPEKGKLVLTIPIKGGNFKATQKKGSHLIFRHLIFRHQDGRRVAISFHKSGDTFPPKTLKNMLEQTRWTEDDLKRLKLIK